LSYTLQTGWSFVATIAFVMLIRSRYDA
jgi:hypothetical protein